MLLSFAKDLEYSETPGEPAWSLGVDGRHMNSEEEIECPNDPVINLHARLWAKSSNGSTPNFGNDYLVAFYGNKNLDNYIKRKWRNRQIVATYDGQSSCCTLERVRTWGKIRKSLKCWDNPDKAIC